ncbi:MAG TPA: DUF1553 domain-containing protein [Chthonomonadaceae bacterium]|nr:DUF1553 domain-containing protein [Chthonomonadaceae bacterium]
MRTEMGLGAFALLGLLLWGPEVQAQEAVPQQAATLLSSVCLKCHNGQTRAGGIDLSTRAAAMQASALGTEDPAQSRLIRAVASGKMPPTGKLPDAQIALLRRWIETGATYPRPTLIYTPPAIKPLWSLQPVKRSPLPKTPYDALAKTPLDRFIFDRLAQKGLKPSQPAPRLALLRRVTLDLTGLPPTPSEISAFLADTSPNAYEKVVDRLLASPAYGERWARHWLDVVRYGESMGYEQNHLRPNAWPYRDYVIRAFNEDKPYPQFITEQLAGDVVGKGDPKVETATGFLVAGIHDTVGIQTEEGTRQQRSNDLDDIVSTTAAAFLGLTVNCARCHDHKFDPIPQKDYYRLTAVFAGVRHGERPLSTRPLTSTEQQELDAANRQVLSIQNRLNELDSLGREAFFKARGVTSTRPAVTARLNVDDFPPVTARFVRFTILATRDDAEPCIDELQVFGPEGDQNLALASTGARATASDLLPGYAIHQIPHLNDGKFGNDWSWISNTRGGGWAQIELPQPVRIQRVVWSRDGGEIPRFDDRLPTRYRIEVSDDGKTWRTVSTEAGRAGSNNYIHPDELRKALTPEQRMERDAKQAELQQLKERVSALNSVTAAYIGQFTGPDPIFLLKRGDVMQRGEPVQPGAFSAVTTLPSDLVTNDNAPEPERRLALARWIGDEKNPLTARVLVNRIWQYHFGRGLVSTPSDFGNNGEKPTHPELLDYLASDFMANGWKIKRLHKLIVMSYTYCQTSDANAKGLAVDAGNQLLWHMPLRRLEAEAIRDSILATSGKLDCRMYGPSYRLFKYNVVNVAIYDTLESYGPETWRRGIYQQAARSIHDELLSTFDCPESSQRAARRESTTTALQALSLLNGPFIVQQAIFFAERVRSEAGVQPAAQVDHAFLLAFGRSPDTKERAAALKLLADRDLGTLCRALLNANEFLYY